MHKLLRMMIISLLAGWTFTVQAQMEIPEIATVTRIAEGLHVVMGAGGNIAVSSGPDGVFIVDDDMPPLARKIEAAIATITDQPVRMVFNTHWHFDHTGGNEFFGSRGAIIVAHDNVRRRMSTVQFSRLMAVETPASPPAALPIVTFDSKVTFHINGQTIRAVHIPQPAHTDGDSLLFFVEANVVHAGDLFFNGMYPVIDLSAGGTAAGMIFALDELLSVLDENTIVIPGHGPIADKAAVMAFRTMLATVNNRIELLIAEGKTADEVVALRPTYNYDADWEWSFMPAERWTRLMYDSVKASNALVVTIN